MRVYVTVVALVASGFACMKASDRPSGPVIITPEWVDLSSRSWSVPANSEIYLCRRHLATSDMTITGFRTVIPPGQHRLIVSISPTAQPTGDLNCPTAAPFAGSRVLYSAGIGTGDLTFPAGVGVRIPSGYYVTLMVHVVNDGTATLTGTSSVSAYRVAPAVVTKEAELTFVGPASVSVPALTTGHVESGGCPLKLAWDVFGLLPITRAWGTHVQVTSERSGAAPIPLHDAPFNLLDQPLHSLPTPITVPAGALLRVTCTYTNAGNVMVTFGDSSTNEICYTGVYHTPTTSGGAFCVSDSPLLTSLPFLPPKRTPPLAS